MAIKTVSVRKPKLAMVAVRVVFITIVVTLMCFAVALFLGIAGILVVGMLKGGISDISAAYRHIAFPIAVGAMVVGFIGALVVELREYRKRKAAYAEWRKAA